MQAGSIRVVLLQGHGVCLARKALHNGQQQQPARDLSLPRWRTASAASGAAESAPETWTHAPSQLRAVIPLRINSAAQGPHCLSLGTDMRAIDPITDVSGFVLAFCN